MKNNESVGTHTESTCESITNYDRIRNMSVDEMATVLGNLNCDVCPAKQFCDSLGGYSYKSCNEVFKHWLESEVTEE